MTEARKAIIELISEYMDKTLSEGCLVKFMGEPVSFITKDKDEDWDDMYILNVWSRCEVWICPPILWHYDITAVLKYIKSFDSIMCYVFDKRFWKWDVFQIYKLADTDQEFWYYYIPNKPLHLYTEQQDKDTLIILKELEWK